MTDADNNPPSDSGRLTLIDRLLKPFADVKGGEGVIAMIMLSNVFLLLTAYYVLKDRPGKGSSCPAADSPGWRGTS